VCNVLFEMYLLMTIDFKTNWSFLLSLRTPIGFLLKTIITGLHKKIYSEITLRNIQ